MLAFSSPIAVLGQADGVPTREGTALLIDKPAGWTSFDVVARLRRLTGIRKLGHAGTLDPMATGLLICLLGRAATKHVAAFMDLRKTYTGTLRLGETTPSYDAETEVIERRTWAHVTDAMLDGAREAFTGVVEQTTPMYSAVKVGGERLYKKARRGETVERPSRTVRIYRFEWTARDGPDLSFVVDCSKGTYIRSLAHDLGQRLSTGAHLVALRRIAIGPYSVEDAWSLEALSEASQETNQHPDYEA